MSLLGLLTYVFANTNILQGKFSMNKGQQVVQMGNVDYLSDSTTIEDSAVTTLDLSIISVSKTGSGATEIDWDSATRYTLGEWTVTTDEILTIGKLYSYIGEPKSTSTSQNNYTQDYFANTQLIITDSDGTYDTTSVTFPGTDYSNKLKKDTYTFTLTGEPIAAKKADFDANGFNGNQITLHINSVTTEDGDYHQQGIDDGADYFTYEEKVTGNTAFSYGGYAISSNDYVATTETEEEEATADEAKEVIELSLLEKYSGTDLMSTMDAADLTVYDSSDTETPVDASIEKDDKFSISVPAGEYYVTVSRSGFVQNTFGPYTTAIDGYNAVTNEGELEYGYYVDVKDSAGATITNASVSTNGTSPACDYVGAGLYACSSVAQDLIYSVGLEGYDDFNGEFANLRIVNTDASETASATLSPAGSGITDYVLKFQVDDMYGDLKTGLTELNFAAAAASGEMPQSGTEITDLTEDSDGIYTLYVPAAGDYRVELTLDGYVDYAMDGYTAEAADTATSKEIVLTYGNAVAVLDTDEKGLTGATVLAGDDFAVTCEEKPEGLYACAIPVDDTSTDFSVTLTGYKDATGSFLSDREQGGDFYYYTSITLLPDDTATSDTTSEVTATDSDGDGLSDAEEATYGTDPDLFDSDGDGLSDGDEVDIYGTNPLNADSDYDGYNDYTEISTGNDPLVYSSTSAGSASSTTSSSTTSATSPVTAVTTNQRTEILSSSTYRCSDPFTDTNGHWAEDAICRLYKVGIVNGKDYNTFAPDDQITRAEFLKIAILNAGYTTDDAKGLTEDYTDVSPSDWFYPYVKIAENKGFLRNQGGAFNPNDRIKRADAVVLSVRIAKQTLYGYIQSDIPFSDVVTSDYFAYAVIIASNTKVASPEGGTEGIIGGYQDGTFRPNNYISRAEVAALTIRAYLAWYK